MNEELKLLWKGKKKIGGGGVRSGRGWGSRGGGLSIGRGLGGSNVGVRNLGGDVGYGGCEPRIEGIVQCTTTT